MAKKIKEDARRTDRTGERERGTASAAFSSFSPLPSVPHLLIVPLWFAALALPNLVYSGVRFADTLHIIKWTVAGVPVALALGAAGLRLLLRGGRRLDFRLDIFGAMWGFLLLYCAAQPLWVAISSMTGWAHELICFAAVWAFYILSENAFPNWGLRPLLWLANLNASINVLFAELQIRNLNNLAFLDGTVFAPLRSLSSLILPTPYNYIGNTAQQNMFGLWLAVCVMNTVYLFVYDDRGDEGHGVLKKAKEKEIFKELKGKDRDRDKDKNKDKKENKFKERARSFAACLPNLFLMFFMAVNFWGLINTTSRSGLLSLFVGLCVLGFVAWLRFGRGHLVRLGLSLLLMAAVFCASLSVDRIGGDNELSLINKTADIVQNAETMGGRDGIWRTSFAMFKEHPKGVGIGQFKWHYLEAQREVFKTNSDHGWQYTHWAHNEFLQWFCEAGVAGGAFLLLMYAVWLAASIRGIFFKNNFRDLSGHGSSLNGRPSPEAVWGFALIVLISFCALWTRPFHRIENILWLALAFAITNRDFLTGRWEWRVKGSDGAFRLAGAVCVCASIAGIVYLGSGIQGNLLLRRALSTQDEKLQLYLLEKASAHPIVYEDAQKNLGYHYLQVGDQKHDLATMSRGFNILWQHFRREPHSEDMSKLLNWSQRFQVEDVIRELASYLKPGTYHLTRRPGRDASGKTVSALVVASGPGPDENENKK